MTSLVTRALTQYDYDAESGQMVLVPDLATDLGTPNDDFTEWKFTLRDGAKWETGAPVTADEVAFGIQRSMDGKTFPNGPGLYYSNPYFLGGEDYKGPYTTPTRRRRRSRSTATPSPSRWPSRSPTSPTTPRSRRWARSRPTRPSVTRRSTPSTRWRPVPTRSTSTPSASR